MYKVKLRYGSMVFGEWRCDSISEQYGVYLVISQIWDGKIFSMFANVSMEVMA